MDKVLRLLGLAYKAGKVVSGEFATEQLIKSGKAGLVIVAGDASENTKKLFRDKCAHYHTKLQIYADREKLGKAIGKEFRASVGVKDEGFSKELDQQIRAMEVEHIES